MNISDLRQDYTTGGLLEAEAGYDPFALFRLWFDDAVKFPLPDVNAMTLATVSAAGQPSARIVLLKGMDHGFTFFTNYESRKSRELESNPRAALVFFWQPLERQVRIEGTVSKTSVEESEAYFHSRPLDSKLGSWASEQSGVIECREVLEKHHMALLAKYPDGNVPRPPHWGGYRLVPAMFEFWQGRPSRLHDRLRYSGLNGGWKRERLAP